MPAILIVSGEHAHFPISGKRDNSRPGDVERRDAENQIAKKCPR
jgi:hypothetical protein